jgi:integrase
MLPGMAWTEPLPDGGYRGMWRDASGRRRSASFDRRTRQRFDGPRGQQKALAYAIGQEAIARDNGPQADHRGLTWGQWSERWLQLRRTESNTGRTDLARIRIYLEPRWGRVRLRDIRHRDIQAWINELDDSDLSGSTVRQINYLLSASLKAAVRSGHIQSNPCQLIELPTANTGKERYLTKSEFWYAHYWLSDQLHADAAVLLAFTGLRFGELAGLHWTRVDLERKQLTVAETWEAVEHRVKPYPKSKKPRQIPLADPVLDVLASLPPASGPCGQPHPKGSPRCTSPLVLTDPGGQPIDYDRLARDWRTALDLAGLEPARIHDLRHSCASWLVQDGVPIAMVQKIMGHSSITTTMRYAHFAPGQYDQVLATLNR